MDRPEEMVAIQTQRALTIGSHRDTKAEETSSASAFSFVAFLLHKIWNLDPLASNGQERKCFFLKKGKPFAF